jgi:hypothetical protein
LKHIETLFRIEIEIAIGLGIERNGMRKNKVQFSGAEAAARQVAEACGYG